MKKKKVMLAKFDFFAWKYVGTLQPKKLVIWYSPKLIQVEIKKSRGLNLLAEGIIQLGLAACSRKNEWDNKKLSFLFVVFQLVKSLFCRWVSIRVSRTEAETEKRLLIKNWVLKNICFDIYWLIKSRRSVLIN